MLDHPRLFANRPQVPTKDHIINEIRRVAEKNGRPPGRQVFETETGIRTPEWYGVHFPRWSDALREAGFDPNDKQAKFSSEHVLRKYAETVRHFGRVPTEIEIRMYARERPGFPAHKTFRKHFGNKHGLVAALATWAQHNNLTELTALLPDRAVADDDSAYTAEGWVYLLKSGIHYKIGRSEQLEHRIKQIATALPEPITLEHAIRTDDPPGIEGYWHRRFSEKRAHGEWVRLTAADVRAFKRRRFQ